MGESDDDIFALSDRFVEEWCALQPTLATEAGVAGFDHQWGDFSPHGVQLQSDLLTSVKGKLANLPVTTDRWAVLASRVLADYVDDHLSAIEHGDPFRDLNNVASSLQALRETFDLMPTETPEDWANIASRLNTLDEAVGGYVARLEEGRRRGVTVARRQVEAGVGQALASAGPNGTFDRYLEEHSGEEPPPGALRGEIARGVETARVAFAELAHYLEVDYLPSAAPEDAVGEERYRRYARSHVGMALDPLDVYAWGWEEVGRLRQAMTAEARRVDPDLPLTGVLDVLKTDPARAASDPSTFLALIADRQEQALAELSGTHFDVPEPIRRIDVRLAPPGGALGAYYTPPSEDFRRAGTVWYAFESEHEPVPMFDQISTAYHEGFPGHHLQVGLQVSLADSLSRFHRLLAWWPGYGEGWALYAELLMDELGYLERPDYRLGMLAAQMLRACRVVIDIGLHLALPIPAGASFHGGESWSADLAVTMLTDWAFLDRPYAVSEVTRYLGWPGQAISYKLGERALLDLRAEARARPGFDLKEFHARVLGSGPVGLDHLRELVLAEQE